VLRAKPLDKDLQLTSGLLFTLLTQEVLQTFCLNRELLNLSISDKLGASVRTATLGRLQQRGGLFRPAKPVLLHDIISATFNQLAL
jgi:hypothetical protein